MAKRVLTGALALVKKDGETIGKMKDIRVQETIRRVRVGGIGTILPQEQDAVEWNGSITCSFYEVDFRRSGVPQAIRRDVANVQEFEDQLTLDTDGVQVDIFAKVTDVIDPNTKLRRPKLEPYATIGRMLLEGDNIDITEGQASGRNQSFTYLDPILFKPEDPSEE